MTSTTALVLVGVLAAVGFISARTEESDERRLGSLSGFSPGGQFPSLPDADLGRALDVIAHSGAEWVRVDFAWVSVEREPGVYDWSNLDRVTRATRQAGLKVLALVAYSPQWARPDCDSDKCPPESVEDYADFLTAAAHRYGPEQVQAWELWNEPNIAAFWRPAPDVGAYAALLRAGSDALRSVRPDARILSAGLSPASTDGRNIAPVDFVTSLYDLGAMDEVDIVALHPYSGTFLPLEQGTEQHNAFLQMEQVHAIMAAHGDGDKHIWGTEFGVATGRDGRAGTEDLQAAIIEQGFARLHDGTWPWLGALFVYSLRDERNDPTDLYSNYGLLRHDWSAKPAFAVFEAAMRRPLPPPRSRQRRPLRIQPLRWRCSGAGTARSSATRRRA